MASFICDRCGKCCVSLGRHITIERQLSDRDYYCRCAIDNTVFPASVDPEFREDVAGEYETGEPCHDNPDLKPCIFSRKSQDGKGTTCAIYATRPKVCREFRCYRMLIRNREGAICGRVIGKNTLRTEDPVLQGLWDARVTALPSGNPAAWTRSVSAILGEYGYRAEAVE